MTARRIAYGLAAPVLAIGLAVLVSTILLVATGNSALQVFDLLASQVTDLDEMIRTVNRAAPYYISGVAVAIGFKMNLFNIGVEGQYRLAGIVAAAAGASLPLPGPLRLVGVIIVAMLVGGAWAGIAGVLRAYRGVSEVIATIMLNTIAFGVARFLLTRYFEIEDESFAISTARIPEGGRIGNLDWLIPGTLENGLHLSAMLILAALVGVGYFVLVWRSRFGYDLRASGANPNAARASGIDAKRMIVLAMLISGAVAGLVGLSRIIAQEPYAFTEESFIAGFGFTGIAVALLGRNNPLGIALAALLWAYMDVARTPLAGADLPNEITTIMQGIIVLSVVIAYEVVQRTVRRAETAAIAAEIDEEGPPAPVAEPAGSPA